MVTVEVYGANAQQNKSLKDSIKTGVELKLRQSGVGVIEREWLETPGFPMLRATVGLYEAKATGPSEEYIFYSSSFRLDLRQAVLLKRDPDVASGKNEAIMATTWEAEQVGYAPRDDLREQIRRTAGDLVEEFLNDYLSVNPK